MLLHIRFVLFRRRKEEKKDGCARVSRSASGGCFGSFFGEGRIQSNAKWGQNLCASIEEKYKLPSSSSSSSSAATAAPPQRRRRRTSRRSRRRRPARHHHPLVLVRARSSCRPPRPLPRRCSAAITAPTTSQKPRPRRAGRRRLIKKPSQQLPRLVHGLGHGCARRCYRARNRPPRGVEDHVDLARVALEQRGHAPIEQGRRRSVVRFRRFLVVLLASWCSGRCSC